MESTIDSCRNLPTVDSTLAAWFRTFGAKFVRRYDNYIEYMDDIHTFGTANLEIKKTKKGRWILKVYIYEFDEPDKKFKITLHSDEKERQLQLETVHTKIAKRILDIDYHTCELVFGITKITSILIRSFPDRTGMYDINLVIDEIKALSSPEVRETKLYKEIAGECFYDALCPNFE